MGLSFDHNRTDKQPLGVYLPMVYVFFLYLLIEQTTATSKDLRGEKSELTMRLCSGPGCGRAVPDDVRFCDECKPEHKPLSRVERGETDPIMLEYGTKRWQTLRMMALRRHILCPCGTTAVIADHNIPARTITQVCRALGLFPGQKYPGFYILENVVGLCRSCHKKKTNTEDADDWSRQLCEVLKRFMPKELTEDEQKTKILEAYGR